MNESDVEQKFILQLLITNKPLGLDYVNSDFKTKPDIRKLKIDKGNAEKLYFPDYAIVVTGLPMLLIEAKAPGENLDEALRQVRLYANEINFKYPKNINPCQKVIVSDGIITRCSYVDSSTDSFEILTSDINSVSPQYNKFLEFASKETITKEANEILKKIRGSAKFIKPKQLLGGRSVQNSEVKENSFGATLSFEFRNIFNPQSGLERQSIVENAYVTTKKILRHVQPIERIIRKSRVFGIEDLNHIEDTENPKEIIDKLRNKENLRNELILLVGNVGSGKSTFTDYLKITALPEEIKKETLWITINLNNAPINKEEIYKWIKIQIIENLIGAYPSIDFEEKDTLLKVYGTEFKALRKGVAQFYTPGSPDYNKLFADRLIELESDPDMKSRALVRYLCTSRGKLLVIALDNCDKSNSEKQLLMFEVATWLKEYYQCLVFLPLRDTTFSIYRKMKPLDTVIKDLVFKIDPPLLREVIVSRLKYTLREMGKGKKTFIYELPNGIKVEYPQSDQGQYLASIVRSLFENTYFNRLISGIAGKDIRKGLEVFLDFCKSGHIDEGEILKMKKFGAEYIIKNHVVSKIILRGNRRYYSGDDSIIKNLFVSYPIEDSLPNPFTRLFILNWLNDRYYIEGPSRIKGFHKAASLINDLIVYGHDRNRIVTELNVLIKYNVIITESQSDYLETEDDLICVSTYGMIHLDLLEDTSYLSAISEDLYFREPNLAANIYKRISGKSGNGHYSFETILENSQEAINYLIDYSNNFIPSKAGELLSSTDLKYYSLDSQKEKIDRYIGDLDYFQHKRIIMENPKGSVVTAEIVSIHNYGVFVEFGLEFAGLIHVSYFEKLGKYIEDYELGDKVEAEIIEFNNSHNRFSLKYIRDIEESDSLG